MDFSTFETPSFAFYCVILEELVCLCSAWFAYWCLMLSCLFTVLWLRLTIRRALTIMEFKHSYFYAQMEGYTTIKLNGLGFIPNDAASDITSCPGFMGVFGLWQWSRILMGLLNTDLLVQYQYRLIVLYGCDWMVSVYLQKRWHPPVPVVNLLCLINQLSLFWPLLICSYCVFMYCNRHHDRISFSAFVQIPFSKTNFISCTLSVSYHTRIFLFMTHQLLTKLMTKLLLEVSVCP